MSKKQQVQIPTEVKNQLKNQENGLLEAVVRDNVMANLGAPADLQRVQVKCIWSDHYRVNVYVGDNVASSRIAHTYFLEADENGKILSSNPPITRVY